MSRKKVTLSYIKNDALRKASYKKRKRGLLKKAEELSILCDVPACVIIYSPYEIEPEVWPPRSDALVVLESFNQLSEIEREKKMMDMTSFTQQRIRKLQDQLNRLRKVNTRKMMENYMYSSITGLKSKNDFDIVRHGPEMNLVISQTVQSIQSQMKAKKGGEEYHMTSYGSAVEFLNYIQRNGQPDPYRA